MNNRLYDDVDDSGQKGSKVSGCECVCVCGGGEHSTPELISD